MPDVVRVSVKPGQLWYCAHSGVLELILRMHPTDGDAEYVVCADRSEAPAAVGFVGLSSSEYWPQNKYWELLSDAEET